MKHQKLSDILLQRKEGVHLIGKQYVVRIKQKQHICSIKAFKKKEDAEELYNKLKK